MNKETTIKLLGYTGTIVAIIMFLSLIEIARANMSGQTHIIIQPLATILNCSIWSTYAILNKDKFVFMANMPGVLLGVFTVITALVK
ncbi:MAG: SemiSWEET family transporter [Candidatus Falkowbacteria bacterium]|nr:SemiSWEET family transporter [Candidatus Falkowbacteria bacterium]